MKYKTIYAIWAEKGNVIIKLEDWGYANLAAAGKKDGLMIHVADFVAEFTKFDPYGNYRKCLEEEVPAEVIENIKYNIAHANGTLGVLHPGLTVEGLE